MDNNSPSTLFSDAFTIINGIKFTHREIDVMVSIAHMRGTSKIASLLDISTRTVETHIANIMRKMDTNSREGIIDFLEHSDRSFLNHKHYKNLVIQKEFKKLLVDVAKSNQKQIVTCYFNVENDCSQEKLEKLKEHLNTCGIEMKIQKRNSEDQRKPEDVFQPHLNGAQRLSFSLWVQESNTTPIPQENFNKENAFFLDLQNYETSCLLLLKKILPHLDWCKLAEDFEKREENLNFPDQELPVKDLTHTPERQTENVSKEKKSKYFVLRVASLTLSLFFAFLWFWEPQFSEDFKTRLKNDSTIRSDLIVPIDNTFLNRPHIVAKLEEAFKNCEAIQTVALVGMGGAGKTTIARKYALVQNANVVWEINATTSESLKDSFESLAYALCKSEEDKENLLTLQNIKNKKEREEKILIFVKEKLKTNSNWFLVYDNVDNFLIIQKYFPSDTTVWGKGKVIVTTNNSNAENNNLIHTFIPMGELSQEEKLHLFTKIIGCANVAELDIAEKERINAFLNNLPPFPLDVSIAAYYIKSTHTPYAQYLENLKEGRDDFETIQVNMVKEASDYTKTRYQIITLSLKQLMESHKDFSDLLLLVGLLNSQNIPISLLSHFKNGVVVDNFVYHLKKYSLITTESVSDCMPTISVHRKTQENILVYLTKKLSLLNDKVAFSSATEALESYIAEALDQEDFSKMKLLVAHCETFLTHTSALLQPTKSTIGGALGCIYYYLQHNQKAQHLLEENLIFLKQSYREDSENMGRVLVYLGNLYRTAGDYEKAKSLLEQSLHVYEKKTNYVRKARALGYLGVVYRDLGRYEKARALLEESFLIHEKYFKNSIGHAWVLAHLGNIYMILGDYYKAKKFLERSLIIYKKQSEEYVGVAWVLNYLGIVHKLLGDYEASKNLLEKSLVITRKHFPDNHIYVASNLFSSASIQLELGEYQKAKDLLQNSLGIYEKTYGKDHIAIARTLKLLGEVYYCEGDLKAAENLINQSLVVFQKKNHSESYRSYESLASIYQEKAKHAYKENDVSEGQKFHQQSKVYLRQALEIVQNCFLSDSIHVVKIQSKLRDLEAIL